jgi:hypothetical protein
MFEQLIDELKRRTASPRPADRSWWLVVVALLAVSILSVVVTLYLDPQLGARRRRKTMNVVAEQARRGQQQIQGAANQVVEAATNLGNRNGGSEPEWGITSDTLSEPLTAGVGSRS